MNQPDEPKKNVALGASSGKPAQSFRKGAIQASIWLRRSTDDYPYYDVSLSRSWKSTKTGKDGYSGNFFARNRAELHAVIDQAADWIEAQPDSRKEAA